MPYRLQYICMQIWGCAWRRS